MEKYIKTPATSDEAIGNYLSGFVGFQKVEIEGDEATYIFDRRGPIGGDEAFEHGIDSYLMINGWSVGRGITYKSKVNLEEVPRCRLFREAYGEVYRTVESCLSFLNLVSEPSDFSLEDLAKENNPSFWTELTLVDFLKLAKQGFTETHSKKELTPRDFVRLVLSEESKKIEKSQQKKIKDVSELKGYLLRKGFFPV